MSLGEGNDMLRILAALLAAGYVAMGLATGGMLAVLAIVGAAIIVAALFIPALAGRTRRLLLVLGALPFAVFAWWSVAAPVSGLLIVAMGMVWISGTATRGAEA